MSKVINKEVFDTLSPIITIAKILRMEKEFLKKTSFEDNPLIKVINHYQDVINRQDLVYVLPESAIAPFNKINELGAELELIYKAFHTLKPKYKENIFLIHFQGLTHKEISKKTSFVESTINRQKKKANQLFLENLAYEKLLYKVNSKSTL